MKRLLWLVVALLGLVTFSCEKPEDYSGDIQELRVIIESLKKTTDSLSAALTNSNSRLTTVSTKVDSIRNALSAINVQISNLTTQINNATSGIASIATQIAGLQTQLNSLTSQVNALLGSSGRFGIRVISINSFADVMDTSKWHYVAITYAPDRRCEIYIDGVKKSDYYRANVTYSFSSLNLAAGFYTSYGGFYKGYIDELRISNVVRTQQQIQDYYEKAIGSYAAPVPAQTADAATIGLWKFDQNQGSILVNSALNAANGTLFGGYSYSNNAISGTSIFFNGVDGRANCNLVPPVAPLSVEFWYKSAVPGTTILQPYGINSDDIRFISQ